MNTADSRIPVVFATLTEALPQDALPDHTGGARDDDLHAHSAARSSEADKRAPTRYPRCDSERGRNAAKSAKTMSII